jgi:hypothetical protein
MEYEINGASKGRRMIKSTFKAIGFTCLLLFSIYAIFLADSKGLSNFAYVIWFAVGYYWWLEDREKAKANEERRFQLLVARVAYLEQQMRETR